MRKLALIVALVLASANAQAGQSRGLIVASNDQPQTASDDVAPVRKAEAPAPQPAKEKAVAKKHETDEAKARRIAARYGISW